jgi:hypothetical protein
MKNLYLQDINSDVAEELRECASDLYFEFVSQFEGTEMYDKYITDHGTHTESTELGADLFYAIEDRLHRLKIPIK